VTVRPTKLDAGTFSLMKLIFDEDMFKTAMADFNIGAPPREGLVWRVARPASRLRSAAARREEDAAG
jgi:hypothetical protein